MSTGSHQEDKTASIEGIPPTWQSTPVNYLFRIVGGDGFAPELQGESSGDLPFLKNSDISSGITRISTAANYVSHALARREGFSLVPPKSILMGKIGESMKKNHRVLNTVACCIDNNMQAMVPDVRLITPEYGLYALKLLNATDFNNGGPVPSINNVKWKRARIPIPLLHEQRLIANVLDDKLAKIDQAMSLLRRELETMEQLKKSLIYEAVTKGLDPTVPMRPSGVDWIGDIPEHWEAKKLKFIASFGSGTNLTSEEISETGDYPVYGGNGIRGYYSEFNNDSSRVLVGRQGALCGNVQLGVAPFWATDHAVVVKELSGYGKKYAFYALTAMNLNRLSMAAAQPGLSVEKIVCEFSPVPPLAEQESVASTLESSIVGIEAVLEKKHEQLEVLKQQRLSLIFEYVTGKRRVNEVA